MVGRAAGPGHGHGGHTQFLVDTGTALAAGTIHCLLGDLISGHRAVQCTVGDAFTEHGVIEKYMLPKKIFVTPSI